MTHETPGATEEDLFLDSNAGGHLSAAADGRSTRRTIVETMAGLLESQGYHGTGLSQIIKESGAPRGSLYYYFPEGKEELAAEAILLRAQSMAAQSRRLLGVVPEAAQALGSFFDGLIDYFESAHYCGGAPLAAVALETAGSSERLREACSAAYALLKEPFTEMLVRGGFAPQRAEMLSTLINASIEGGVVLARAERSTRPLCDVRDELIRLVNCSSKADVTA